MLAVLVVTERANLPFLLFCGLLHDCSSRGKEFNGLAVESS